MPDKQESEQQELIKLRYSFHDRENGKVIKLAKDIDLAGLRKQIWDDQCYAPQSSNEEMTMAMKIFRPPHLMPMDEDFSDEAKITAILQIEDFNKVYELFIAGPTVGMKDHIVNSHFVKDK